MRTPREQINDLVAHALVTGQTASLVAYSGVDRLALVWNGECVLTMPFYSYAQRVSYGEFLRRNHIAVIQD